MGHDNDNKWRTTTNQGTMHRTTNTDHNQHLSQQQMTHHLPPASRATAHGVDGGLNDDGWMTDIGDSRRRQGGGTTITTTTTRENERQRGWRMMTNDKGTQRGRGA